jgi:hypothetical protein
LRASADIEKHELVDLAETAHEIDEDLNAVCLTLPKAKR